MYHRNGYPTAIQAGDIIEFDLQTKFLTVSRSSDESKSGIVGLKWLHSGSISCFYLYAGPLASTKESFIILVEILANALNLGFKVLPTSAVGPRCEFVKKT